MRKLFIIILGIISCFSLASCGKGAEGGFPGAAAEFTERFNEGANGTAYELGEAAKTDDGALTIATRDENASVLCYEDNGALSKIEIEGAGMFQPGLASYDYMVYAVISCNPDYDYKTAGDLIASMYYEAYTGGDAVVMAYDGVKYSFEKQTYYCLLTLEKAEEDKK